MTKVVAVIIAAHVIISPYKDLVWLETPYDWRETLPLHMCDISEIFLVWFFLGGPRVLYTCAFFWGLGGAAMAILTPDVYKIDPIIIVGKEPIIINCKSFLSLRIFLKSFLK